MDITNIIESASELLKPIIYQPNYIAWFVRRNDVDMGESDFCEKCINKALYLARKSHREERNKILDKYLQIETTGFYNGIDCRHYKKEFVEASKKGELKSYPAKVKFTIEGHDPDFGGGQTEPLSCELCGDYFHTNFHADEETAKYLWEDYKKDGNMSDPLKWKLDIAFDNFNYSPKIAQECLLKIANRIIKQSEIKLWTQT